MPYLRGLRNSFAQKKHSLLYLITILSFFFQSYYFSIGFSLKAFYVVCPVAWIISTRLKFVNELQLSEAIFLLFLLAYTSTGIYSYDPESSLRFNMGVYLLIFIYLILKSILRRLPLDELTRILIKTGLVFNGVSSALYTFGLYKGGIASSFEDLTVIHGVMYDRGIPRLVGPLKDPNFYVMFNSIFFFIAISFLRQSLCRILLSWSFINILLTLSRGGALALVAGLFIYISMSHGNRLGRTFQIFGFTALAVSLILYTIPEAQNFLAKRIESAENASGRFDIWRHGMQTFFDNPYGGIGVFSFLSYNVDNFGGEHYMHNTFLEVLAEGGIFVFFSYFIFWLCLLMTTFNNILRRRNKMERQFGVSLFCTLIVIFISFASISAVINEFFILVLALTTVYLRKTTVRI